MLKRQITRVEAVELARAYADAQGWPWTEPVKVFREFRAWRIFTNADKRGGNVTVWVNAFTGEVRRDGFAPR